MFRSSALPACAAPVVTEMAAPARLVPPRTVALRTVALLAVAPLACLLLTGCHITKHTDGNNKDVDIQTPFGSTSIKTNNGADTSAIGISPYPGAVPVKDKDSDTSNADVNLSFGNFHLGVKAASFLTPDSTDKVIAFYRDDLKRYGDVIECRGHEPVGSPTRTAQGLTCNNNDDHKKVSTGDDLELRAGSQQHEHIVGVDSRDNGTKIGLVLLDLPSHLGNNSKQPE
jgi:hypothetical protein